MPRTTAALTGGTFYDATVRICALRQAQLDVKTAQANLDSATIYAPMSGTVMTLKCHQQRSRLSNTTSEIDT